MRKGILAAALSLLGGSTVAWGQEMAAPVVVSSEAPMSSSAAPKIWGSAEYLLWWSRAQNLSTPIVTSTTNVAAINAGGLNDPGATVLLGTNGIAYPVLSGLRLTIGGYLDSEGTMGAEVRGFVMQDRTASRSFASSAAGVPQLGLPIIDNLTKTGENSIIVTSPGIANGGVAVATKTQLWGFEVNGILNLTRMEGCSVDAIVGFRYANLQESLAIAATTNALTAAAAGGGTFFNGAFVDGPVTSLDAFQTRNQFYGGQIGARADMEFGRFFVDVTGKLALGSTTETLTIGGASANGGKVIPGGVYAVASNSGTFTSSTFSVIPEFEAKVGYKITDNIRGFIGYNFMFWSQVMRPGEQIDRNSNTNLIPTVPPVAGITAAGPSVLNARTGYWAQGLNFGVEFKY